MRVLFQGDSVTDAGRDRTDPHHLGNGYVRFAARMLEERRPDIEWEFLNLGMSCHRSKDLVARWQADCLDFKPDIVSILIGINDVWRGFDENDPTTPEQYEQNYRCMLEGIRQQTKAQIVLLEPYAALVPERQSWHIDMGPKIAVLRRLALEYAAAYVPLDGLLAAASIRRPPAYWASDGVHPTDKGAWLIAGYVARAIEQLV